MPWIVDKCSAPGWTKTFETEVAACTELRSHICGDCMAGTLRIVDTSEPDCLRAEIDGAPRPDPHDINQLLGTACGLEYEVRCEGVDVDPDKDYDVPEDDNAGTPSRQVAHRFEG